jgi:glycosyltransferase involved in cell wall biosynthesis
VYENRRIAVVVPAYNEETQIGKVIETMPEFVDRIVVIDDCSKDKTSEVVKEYAEKDPERVHLIRHEKNKGVGGAISTGYREAVEEGADVVAVMAGDGQMPPGELMNIIEPVVEGKADYAKANRLFTGEAWHKIPKVRYMGNAVLSLMTKVASGYWQLADTQSGFTAISAEAVKRIRVKTLYPTYGYPNDLLVRLNGFGFKAVDVPSTPVYGVGEKSKMRLWKVIPRMTWLLTKCFFWRMKEKYMIRDFHPLVLFYLASMGLGFIGLLLLARVIWVAVETALLGRVYIPPMNALAAGFCLVSALQFALFAMWFDMEYDRRQ